MPLNETIVAAKSVFNTTINYINGDLYNRGADIIKAPFQIHEMLWMLLPLIATMILMEFYFGRYKEEELGWNTAFGNSIVLTFVAIDLFRHTYEPEGNTIFSALSSGEPKILIAIGIFSFAMLLVLIDFFHFLPKAWAYVISSASVIHIISSLGIIVVYSTLPLDWTTLLACVLIVIMINVVLHVLYYIIPSYTSPLQRIITTDENNKKK
jgi:hypothetical protein